MDLGPVAKTLATPLRWALVSPVGEKQEVVGVLSLYGSDIFDKDHKRMLETAASLLYSTLTAFSNQQEERPFARQNSASKIH